MLTKLEEMKLVALCMATDNREAFSRLVVAYNEPLRRFILNLTGGDYCLTDDLSQETFLKAWLAIRSFRGLSGFKTWLFRIAINEFISYRRKNCNSVTMIDAEANVGIETAVDSHSVTEASLDVSTLLKHLPESERIVSLLFYLEDMPIKQISKVTSIPEGTVKSHLNRARNHMSQFLKRN